MESVAAGGARGRAGGCPLVAGPGSGNGVLRRGSSSWQLLTLACKLSTSFGGGQKRCGGGIVRGQHDEAGMASPQGVDLLDGLAHVAPIAHSWQLACAEQVDVVGQIAYEQQIWAAWLTYQHRRGP